VSFQDITKPDAIVSAADEFRQLGKEAFLAKYGFGPAQSYFLRYEGELLDSKAIVGAAHGYQFPEAGPLKAEEFSGGEQTVKAKLEELGFEIEVAKRRNPAWTREELILALDVYLKRWPGIEKDDPELLALSDLLNSLPIHTDRPDGERFRNPNGVHMKLANFARFDPSREGTGLTRGGKLEGEIWEAFYDDREGLSQAVAAIKAYTEDKEDWKRPEEDEDEVGAQEGKLLYRAHRRRERDSGLARKKKASVQKREGKLECEVCGFDFQERYGIAEPYIECHHLKPLAELRPGQRTTLKDLALVCANCHRVLHRMEDTSDLGGLRDRIKQ
jgi:5-methylcytosine-specific restriction enzyme A